jgi:hypothetical protein
MPPISAGFFEEYWHVFALTCALFAISLAPTGRYVRKRTLLTEFSFVWGATLAYTLVRGMERTNHAEAVRNSERLISVERFLGINHEIWLQQRVIRDEVLVHFANVVYVWWHWPVLVGVLIWLFVKHNEEYTVYRNAMLIAGMIGLVLYAMYPAAPPRFVPGMGLNDTVTDRAIFNNILLPASLANLYAAMPSLHAGWNLIVSVALVRHATHPLARGLGYVMPTAMFFAIVATGNHFIIDGIAGDTIAIVGMVGALALYRRSKQAELSPATVPTGHDDHPGGGMTLLPS